MRPVVSYDDITPQSNASLPPQIGPPLPSSTPQPPAKKRRTSHHQKAQQHQQYQQRRAPPQQQYQRAQVQHWDDPGSNAQVMNYDEETTGAATYAGEEGHQEEEQEEEESRYLTHEEIWDDSALVDAWNSATAEYESFHGKGKKWKEEPVKKSPLWYNVPPPEKKVNGKAPAVTTTDATAAEDSQPHNFESFVPTHDPSLASALENQPTVDFSDTSGAFVSQDEAFTKALSATYWAGYWTAVYHYQRSQQAPGQDGAAEAEEEAEEEGEEGEEEEVMDDLLPTQR